MINIKILQKFYYSKRDISITLVEHWFLISENG